MVKFFLSRNEKDGLTLLFEAIDEDKDSIITLSEMSKVFKDKFSMQVSDEVFDKLEK